MEFRSSSPFVRVLLILNRTGRIAWTLGIQFAYANMLRSLGLCSKDRLSRRGPEAVSSPRSLG
jgi:hypothetical protein